MNYFSTSMRKRGERVLRALAIIIGSACCLGACSESTSPAPPPNTSGQPSTSEPGPGGGGVPPEGPGQPGQPGMEDTCASGEATGRGAPIAKYDASKCGTVPTSNATTCPVEKFAFQQCTACMNDDSVELCLDKNDTATLCAISAIAPGTKVSGGMGRAGCKAPEVLIVIPVNKQRDCKAEMGAATNEAWSRLCAVASLANVKKISATFYE